MAVHLKRRSNWGVGELLHPKVYVDLIMYPYPKSNVGLAELCY